MGHGPPVEIPRPRQFSVAACRRGPSQRVRFAGAAFMRAATAIGTLTRQRRNGAFARQRQRIAYARSETGEAKCCM